MTTTDVTPAVPRSGVTARDSAFPESAQSRRRAVPPCGPAAAPPQDRKPRVRKTCGVTWPGQDPFPSRTPHGDTHACVRPPGHPPHHNCWCSARLEVTP